jgi:hypothetical protein
MINHNPSKTNQKIIILVLLFRVGTNSITTKYRTTQTNIPIIDSAMINPTVSRYLSLVLQWGHQIRFGSIALTIGQMPMSCPHFGQFLPGLMLFPAV